MSINRRRVTYLISLIVLLTVLSACGNNGDDSSEPSPTPSAVSPVDSSPSGESSVTVGALADAMAAAWPSVTTVRSTMTTSYSLPAASNGSPAPPRTVTRVAVNETILPDRKHSLTTVDGVVDSELILVDGKIYVRGPGVPGLDPARANPDAWTALDPDGLDPSSESAEALKLFLQPLTAPYAGISKDERERAAVPGEPIAVNGLTCATYTIAATTQTGERIEITLAIGTNDLPCSQETRLGSSVSLTTYEYNVSLTINAPPATPIAGSE